MRLLFQPGATEQRSLLDVLDLPKENSDKNVDKKFQFEFDE